MYCSVLKGLEGARQNLLIEEQLNKLAKVFLNNHTNVVCISQHLETFISSTHEQYSKMTKIMNMYEQSNEN